jgi:hypothetical protein
MVVPGTYQVRLTMGGWHETQQFDVRIDPRVAEDGVTQEDLEEQFVLALEVEAATVEARSVLARIREVRDDLPADADEARARLDDLEAQLVTGSVRYSTPMLISQLQYLSGMISRADQKVGADAFVRYEELMERLDRVKAGLSDVQH